MSSQGSEEYRCDCGTVNSATIWNSVNVTLNPSFAEQIIDSSLFQSVCSGCGQTNTLLYPLLFHDMRKPCMTWFDPKPDAAKEHESATSMRLFSKNDPPYQFRLIQDLNNFKEWVGIWRDGLDDLDMLMLKPVVLTQLVGETEAPVTACYYASKEGEGASTMLQYVVFLEGSDQPGSASVPMAMLTEVSTALRAERARIFPPRSRILWSDDNAAHLWETLDIEEYLT